MSVFPYVRCLHLADLHLGYVPRYLGGKELDRAKERDSVLEKAVAFALDPANKIDMVVIAGDLFDTHRPSQDLVEKAISLLGKLERAGLAVVTTPGNHDEITYAGSVYREMASRWPGVLVCNPMPGKVASLNVKGIPIHVYSLAYTGGLTRTSPPLREFPRSDELGIHLAVFHGLLGQDLGDRSLPLDAKALAHAGYDYVALGHLHGFREQALTAGDTGARRSIAAYAGAVEGKGFDDPGTGRFVVANLKPGETRLETEDARARKYKTLEIDLTGIGSEDELHQAVRNLSKAEGASLVRIMLRGSPQFSINIASLEARWRDWFYYLEVAGDTTIVGEAEIDSISQEPTIRGEFVRRLKARLSSATDDEERAVVSRALVQGLAALKGREL